VLRTFSKVHGLAGVRLGYACGHPDLLHHLGRVRSAFSISSLPKQRGWQRSRTKPTFTAPWKTTRLARSG
jgi:histidinol-phosphate/aromatic aminotransferase/cobyric acid decarboxylase-like protein